LSHRYLEKVGKWQLDSQGGNKPKEERHHKEAKVHDKNIYQVEIYIVGPLENEGIDDYKVDKVSAKGYAGNEGQNGVSEESSKKGRKAKTRGEESQVQAYDKNRFRKAVVQ